MEDTSISSRRGKMAISRRRMLNGGTALGAYFLLPRTGSAQHQGHDHSKLDPGPIARAAAAAMDMPFVEPEVRSSVDGVLSTTLSCLYT